MRVQTCRVSKPGVGYSIDRWQPSRGNHSETKLKSYEAAEQIDIVNQRYNANSQYACLLGHSCEVRRYPRHEHIIYTLYIFNLGTHSEHTRFISVHKSAQTTNMCGAHTLFYIVYTYIYIYVCSMVYIARPYILSGVTSMSVFKRRTYHTRQAANSARGRESFWEFAST